MFYANRRRIRRQLEAELQKSTSQQQLHACYGDCEVICGFKSWQQVIAFLLDHGISKKLKDDVLQVLVRKYQDNGTPICGTVLLLAFWPVLIRIARQRSYWNNDDDELWSILQWAFLESARHMDVEINRRRIASRLVRTTANCLRRTCRHEVAFRERKVSLPSRGSPVREWADGLPVQEQCDDSRTQFVLTRSRILRAFRSGRLPYDELQLLSEIDFEGVSLKQAAVSRGLSLEAIKK